MQPEHNERALLSTHNMGVLTILLRAPPEVYIR